MDKNMSHKIMDYNYKVKDEATKLEEQVKIELAAIREEVQRESTERKQVDQSLISSASEFLNVLQKWCYLYFNN